MGGFIVLLSMTGFSRESQTFSWGTLSVEMSTINHRYQDISIRLPRELSYCEPSLNNRLRQSIRRGKIRLSVEVTWSSDLRAVSLDGQILENYYHQIKGLQEKLGNQEAIRLESLLNLPGVTDSASGRESLEEDIEKSLDSMVAKAVDSLQKMRQTEGKDLELDIKTNLESFSSLTGQILQQWEKARDSAVEETRERIKKIFEDNGPAVEESRIAQEIALIADKWDISEELARAQSHIEKFQTVLNSPSSEGLKMDFLIQEMNREVNTVASKVTNAEIRWLAVEAKTALERIREQVQNVE
jgi:uncharacterized protein (TIGR00255 family)